MDRQKTGTLRIDSKTGAVVINETMRIEPHGTLAEFMQSDVYKQYIHDDTSDRVKVLLLKDLTGQDVIIRVLTLGTEVIKDIIIEIPHAGIKKSDHVGDTDFAFLGEIIYQSLSNNILEADYSEKHRSGHIYCEVPWGYIKVYETSEAFAYLSIMYRQQEDETEKTLRIDPQNGAIVINETMRIEPDWTLEEFEQSEAYKKYVHSINVYVVLLLKNKTDRDIVIAFSTFGANLVERVTIEFSHGSPGEADNMSETDFVDLREILYRSFSGYDSEDDSDGYILYRFPWGSAIARIAHTRDITTELDINYRRSE